VSRRFVAATQTALGELLAADLSGMNLEAFLVDGVHFAESCCIVALADHPGRHEGRLSLVEGSTENAWLVTELLVDLRERWLDVTRPVLAVLDGSNLAGPGDLGRTGRAQGAGYLGMAWRSPAP
jgi:hypothetical protein